MPVLRIEKQYFDATETALLAREMGLKNVTERTVREAAYYGDRPLKRTKIGGRVYFALADIENWIAGCKVRDPIPSDREHPSTPDKASHLETTTTQ
jgi:hypothetical protein